jgi:hypothetical protein
LEICLTVSIKIWVNVMQKRYSIIKLLVIISIGMQPFVPMMVNGQNIISADPSDTFDYKSIFINPAVIPFQHRQIMLGMKVYQFGFLKSQDLGLRNSYFSLSLPEAFSGLINLGITGQNFSVPLYDQTSFSVLMARRPIERMSIGIKYNLFAKSYHKGEFDLVNPNDPVFADGTLKLAHSLGAGIIFFPWSTLVIGFSCDHLNRPDVSLFQDNFKQPMVYDFGFRYSWTFFSSSIYLNYLQQHWQMNWLFETRPSASSTLKLGYVQQAAKFAVKLNLVKGLSMSYAFDYPFYEVNQISHGSHQVGFMYDLDHRDRIKKLQYSNYKKGNFPIFNLPSQFFVEIETDKLEIISQKIVRSVDEEIPDAALKNLTEVELAINDSSLNMEHIYGHGYLPNQNLGSLYTSAKYSPKYESWLADNFRSKKINSFSFIADLNSVQRAEQLRDFLADHTSFSDRPIEIKHTEYAPVAKRLEPQLLHRLGKTKCYTLKPEMVSFNISAIKMRKYSGKWKLVISDCSDNEVKTFYGKGGVPEKILWDWRDNEGNLIKPDIYYYSFQWEDRNNKSCKTQPLMFSVTRVSRTLNIDIRTKPEKQNDPGGVVEIKFAN